MADSAQLYNSCTQTGFSKIIQCWKMGGEMSGEIPRQNYGIFRKLLAALLVIIFEVFKSAFHDLACYINEYFKQYFKRFS